MNVIGQLLDFPDCIFHSSPLSRIGVYVPDLVKRVYTFSVAWITEINTHIFAILTGPLGIFEEFHWFGLNPKTLNEQELEATPYLFLHGVHGNQASALGVAYTMKKAGKGPGFTLNLGGYGPGTEEKIKEKITYIAKLYAKQGKKTIKIDLIGHSAGGIEALHYAYITNEKVPHVQVRNVITIAGRAKVSDCFFNRHVNGSALLKKVDTIWEYISKNQPINLHTIAGTHDYIVPCHDALVQQNERKKLLVEGRAHLGILYSGEALEHIANWC